MPAYVALDRGLRAALTAPERPRVDIFSEALDMLRFPAALFEAEEVALLAKKYATQPLDAVVAIGYASHNFAEKHRERLWPHARIVSSFVPLEVLGGRPLGPTTTLVPGRQDVAGTAAIALRLRPATRRLVVLSGSGDFDRRMASVARTQLQPYAGRVAIEYWQEAPLDEFLRRLGQLGREDTVLYLSIARDADGRTFVGGPLAKRLAAASMAPVFGPFETVIGQGVVAGSVYSYEARGRRLGALVHELLPLPPIPAQPVRSSEPATCVADARELERFGIDPGLLPPGCELRFVPASLWRDYRWHVLGALLVVALQAVLILALLLQRRVRMRAESEVRQRRVELAQASRLALAGELTASIAHEINQPLGAILANAGAAEALLKRDPAANAELREILADIRSADLRASEIIRRVRALVTARQAEREPVEVNALVTDVLTLLKGEILRRGVAVEAGLAPGLPPVVVDRVQVQQAIVNLCLNAMEAMADSDQPRLQVRTARAEGGVEIAVADSGPGIAAEHLPKVFDSFFTTKPHGTGLGLAITRSIIETHHGRLLAENRAEGGAVFRIVLPA